MNYAKIFKAIATENRIQIINLLKKNKSMCACEILKELDITQPTLSHHMNELVKVNIVNKQNKGKWNHYSLVQETLDEIADYLKLK